MDRPKRHCVMFGRRLPYYGRAGGELVVISTSFTLARVKITQINCKSIVMVFTGFSLECQNSSFL